ncbi:suppressor of lurcher 1-like [Brachionus plicatilis]|uniref:Suppressor of lurcher 1-like n=1 Tax=Brachionus plicatilis TaxID=10195 RepID=A0A3M7PFC6_BRAPC|nr:suppressor of lurcher 1-like [Brachionus plicatilis]
MKTRVEKYFYQFFILILISVKILAHLQLSPYVRTLNSNTKKDPACCQNPIIIRNDNSSRNNEGYLKEPPVYHEMSDYQKSDSPIECIYTFYGQPGERIQIFYETFELYYPFDVNKFNKIDCRYSDSICLKFYEDRPVDKNEASQSMTVNLNNQNYDLCNCINISFTPRQIVSASNFLQVRFRTIRRNFETGQASVHSRKNYSGYLLRYSFTKDFGFDLKESGALVKNSECKIFFNSTHKQNGYFTTPNYPGLYPRELECHYYFIGVKGEKVQITFHTFDIEGVGQCGSDTKSDYVELSNFQNRDRFFSRFCGVNKPGTIVSDGGFFHVTFYSNNVFDGKGFQASYYFLNTNRGNIKKGKILHKNNLVSAKAIASIEENAIERNKATIIYLNNNAKKITLMLYIVLFLV